jgi:hypothetical protein
MEEKPRTILYKKVLFALVFPIDLFHCFLHFLHVLDQKPIHKIRGNSVYRGYENQLDPFIHYQAFSILQSLLDTGRNIFPE